MVSLGLDIGTTTISAVAIDAQDTIIDHATCPNGGFLPSAAPWERAQDAEALLETALSVAKSFCKKYPVRHIGVTGQQHGIVYLDQAGRVLSPLYTWQDGRGRLPYTGSSYAVWLSQKSGYTLASGYGLATHFYNLRNALVPDNAATLATVADVAAMRLAGRKQPVLDPSNAQSLGFFDLERQQFDLKALTRCGIDPAILPRVCAQESLGRSADGAFVAAAIGDNPASYIGATDGDLDALLLNIGTGSQISLWTERALPLSALEARPYPLGGFLLTGAGLCGGRAWALTERFFRDTVKCFTGIDAPAYDGLERLLSVTTDDGSHPQIITTFDGTRQTPQQRASITNLTPENFTPGQFALGVLHGMIDELYGMYACYLQRPLPPKDKLIGGGNGLRRNPHLRRIAEDVFGMRLILPPGMEEAALGAALYARRIHSAG